MPHQNTDSDKATAQNAATDPHAPNDQARGEHASARPEPRSYAAPSVGESSLAAPAAGEVGDYADLEEASGGLQQGRTNTNREAHSDHLHQGPKTTQANERMTRSGSPDQGTQ